MIIFTLRYLSTEEYCSYILIFPYFILYRKGYNISYYTYLVSSGQLLLASVSYKAKNTTCMIKFYSFKLIFSHQLDKKVDLESIKLKVEGVKHALFPTNKGRLT